MLDIKHSCLDLDMGMLDIGFVSADVTTYVIKSGRVVLFSTYKNPDNTDGVLSTAVLAKQVHV